MLTKLRLVLPITILFFCFYAGAQSGYWQAANVKNEILSADLQKLDTEKLRFFSLQEQVLSGELRKLTSARKAKTIIYFPSSSGKQVPFVVMETPVFSPELTLKFPEIRSFSGVSLQNGKDRVRFSMSPNGLEAMLVRKDDGKKVFLQKASRNSMEYVLFERDGSLTEAAKFICETQAIKEVSSIPATAKLADDQLLRKFRIAVSATGEYTQFHGGTVADALAAINATLTRVNEVFLTDLGITLELVANNDLVIYTDPATDPYQGNLNTEVQNTLTSVIGELNYDVGHLFHEDTNAGNAGFIGSVCRNNQKGSAYSAALNPQGDLFDLDYVSHELGHQFGANHTWSFESEGTGVQAEPASGSTIMGYAGIVDGDNVQSNGDDYFHYYSIFQIAEYIATTSCAIETSLANVPPVILPVDDFIIPKGTAFVLTAEATDPDPADVLSYAWEQIDDGVVTTATFGPENPSGANFRSLPPTTQPSRYFPRLSEVVKGNLTQKSPPINSAWETVATIERDLNFAVTVRDNALEGGQVVAELVNVQVSNGAGPFVVTSQAVAEVYSAGSVQTITWEVANTDLSPVNAQFVDIFLSLDGGLSFPVTLADQVANDGSHEVLLPGTATTQARVMVKASQNIFFAINDSDFTIEEVPIVLRFETLSYDICQPLDRLIPFIYETYGGFNEEVTFSVVGAPAGFVFSFVPETATANSTPVTIAISNTTSVSEGSYPVIVTATAPSFTQQVQIVLDVFDTDYPEVTLLSPADASIDVPIKPLLTWETPAFNVSYDLEIATDINFTSVVETATVIFTNYIPQNLLPEMTYYWRVKPQSNCGSGVFGAPSSFTTLPVNCKTKAAKDLPITISTVGTPTVSSKIMVFDDLPLADVNVALNIEHSFLSDLIISLISPSGTEVILTSNSCSSLSNINAVFDDEAAPFVCSGDPGISGTVKPLGSLASFNGESSFGEWTLLIRDTASADGGSINGFSLEICVEGVFRPDDDGDEVFDDGDDLCLGTPPGTEVNTDGCPVFRFTQNNFAIALESESCISSNDGQLQITANQTLNYTISILGSGFSNTSDFTSSFGLSNLSSGTYNACINANDGTNVYEAFCFNFVIDEPDPLSVLTAVDPDGALLSLDLEGAVLYTIVLNGILYQTTESQLQLDLKNGVNTLKVTSSLECQGSYEELIVVGSDPVIYPNPFVNEVEAYLPDWDGPLEVRIFNMEGRMLRTLQFSYGLTEARKIDFTGLPSGMYLLQLTGNSRNNTYKVIKR